MSETQDVTLESLAWSNNVFQMLFSQVPATAPAQNILTSENSPWEPTSPQTPFPSCSQPCSCHHTAEANHGFIPHSGLPSTLLQAKPLKAFVQRQRTSQHVRTPLEEVPSPGQASLEPFPFGQCLSLHTPTLCMNSWRPGWEQSFSWGHFSSPALALSWYCVSRMLWVAPGPTQPYQTRQTDWKPQCLFDNHLTTLTPTSSFGTEVNILSKYKEIRREKCKLQMHHLSQTESYHGTSVSFLKAVKADLLRTAKTTTLLVKKNLIFSQN